MSNRAIYTVGHSTLPIDQFIALLRHYGITFLADVRSIPGSNAFPQYNKEALSAALKAAHIGYFWVEDLGGRRNRQWSVPPATNAAWENKSFRFYADYALSPAFHKGLTVLEALASKHTVAYMCAEVLWWRCHRRIITDHLLARGWTVTHLMSLQHSETARLNPDAVVTGDQVTYPVKPGVPKQHAVMDSSLEE